MSPGRLVMFPQLLLASLAMLPVSYVHIFTLVLDLLSKVLLHVQSMFDCTTKCWLHRMGHRGRMRDRFRLGFLMPLGAQVHRSAND